MAMRQLSPVQVQYKGRAYRLLWEGPTKYGERAKLQFMDGSKDFWVDASLICSVQPVAVTSRPTAAHRPASTGHAHRSGRCRGCGGPIVDAPHHRAMEGYCGSCAFDEFDI